MVAQKIANNRGYFLPHIVDPDRHRDPEFFKGSFICYCSSDRQSKIKHDNPGRRFELCECFLVILLLLLLLLLIIIIIIIVIIINLIIINIDVDANRKLTCDILLVTITNCDRVISHWYTNTAA